MLEGALNSAVNGLLASERRAGEAAQRIVSGTAALSNSVSSAQVSAPSAVLAGAQAQQAQTGAAPAAQNSASAPSSGSLVRDIVSLNTEVNVFRANAAVFRAADENLETLGRLFDDEA